MYSNSSLLILSLYNLGYQLDPCRFTHVAWAFNLILIDLSQFYSYYIAITGDINLFSLTTTTNKPKNKIRFQFYFVLYMSSNSGLLILSLYNIEIKPKIILCFISVVVVVRENKLIFPVITIENE